MARLIVTTSAGDQTVELPPGAVITVGRDAANKLPLPGEAGLSRRHCRIGPAEGDRAGWEVVDMGSTNKTRVAGAVIKQRVLTHGDEIEIGSVKIRFEDPEEAERLDQAMKQGVCFLEWVTGDRKGERILLEAARTTVGRRESNTLALDDRMVSGHHAEIERDLNGYTIRDLGSTNGTLVNGEPISEALLSHGARVRIGNSRFAFKDPSMKDVEVELAHFDEDEGWGMMGEIDLSRARGSRSGILVVALLLLAAGAGAYFLMQQEDGRGSTEDFALGFVENGDFEDPEELLWSADRIEGVRVEVKGKSGKGGFLSVRNAEGEDAVPTRVTYDEAIETVGDQPLRFRARVKGSGDDPVRYVVVWGSEPTEEELKSGVRPLERTDLLGAAGRSWRSIEQVRTPPGWARAARFGVWVSAGSSASLDDVQVLRDKGPGPRPTAEVRTFKTAALDGHASLDLMATETVLLTGVRPLIEVADVGIVSRFEPAGPASNEDGALVAKGAFVHDDGELPAEVRWQTTQDGLQVNVTCPGAKAVGIQAAAPAWHLGGLVSVLGDFLPKRLPIREGEDLDRVSRTLMGDPVPGASGTPTMLEFVQADEKPLAKLRFVPSADAGLVKFNHWVSGDACRMDLITDFTRRREQAQSELDLAKGLANTAPGRAISELRTLAQTFPFEEEVRDEALRRAGELEERVAADVQALEKAVRDFRIYRSREALASMEALGAKLGRQFKTDEELRPGTPEHRVAELVQEVETSRMAYEAELAAPAADRLERLAGLLADMEGYRPMAAVYARAMIQRFSGLGDAAPDVTRRLVAAQELLKKLESDEGVRAALPPVPPGS